MAQIFKPLYSAFPSKDEITNKMCFLFLYYFFFVESVIQVYDAMVNCSDKLEET